VSAAKCKPVWVSLPVEDGEPLPRLNDGDSYVVRLVDGTELWAVYVVGNGAAFLPCDDEGNEIPTSGYDSPVPLDVAAVCVSGYGPGFGPSCPVAGAAPRIHLVVASPSLVKIINESQRKARELLGERFGAAS
jgi:hypothetical protein